MFIATILSFLGKFTILLSNFDCKKVKCLFFCPGRLSEWKLTYPWSCITSGYIEVVRTRRDWNRERQKSLFHKKKVFLWGKNLISYTNGVDQNFRPISFLIIVIKNKIKNRDLLLEKSMLSNPFCIYISAARENNWFAKKTDFFATESRFPSPFPLFCKWIHSSDFL